MISFQTENMSCLSVGFVFVEFEKSLQTANMSCLSSKLQIASMKCVRSKDLGKCFSISVNFLKMFSVFA